MAPSLGAILSHTDGPPVEADGAVDAERAHRALENAVRFPQASTGPFLSIHPRKTPKGPKMALGNPDRPNYKYAFKLDSDADFKPYTDPWLVVY